MTSLPKRHRFEEKLSEAEKWEEKVAPALVDAVVSEAWRKAGRLEQRSGIDVIVKLREGRFDVKFRDNKWYLKDILIETASVVEKNVPGWFYRSDADAILYLWWNKSKTGIMPIGYLIFIKDERLKKWFEENRHKYPEYQAETSSEWGTWHTKFTVIPIRDFPKGTLKRVKVNLPKEGKQSTLNMRHTT